MRRLKMNSKIFKQHQGSWATKPYPTRGCTVAGAGCGLVACTHIAIEQERYKNWTPENLRPWMLKKGFAVAGQGTRWEGITKTLEHIGHKNVVRIYNDPMSEAWKELNKGNRIGIILFDSSIAPNGIRWTSCGHYVAFTGYKVKDGKHLFYCKDSGPRDHDGWYSYERSMRNCVSKMWIVERVGAQVKSPTATSYRPTTEYKGKLPKNTVKKGKEGAGVKALQRFLNWCINAGLTVDGVAGDKTVFAIKVFQKTYNLVADGIFGKASKAKAKSIVKAHQSTPSVKPSTTWQSNANEWARKIAKKKYHYVRWGRNAKSHTCPICNGREYDDYYGWNCIGFAFNVWRHGGKLGTKCNCGVIDNAGFNKLLTLPQAKANKYASDRIGKPVEVIRNGGKPIPLKMIKAGDLGALYRGKEYYHLTYLMGGDKYAESNTTGGIGSSKNIRADIVMSKTFKANLKLIIRYAGK